MEDKKIIEKTITHKLYEFLDGIAHLENSLEFLEPIFDIHFQHDQPSEILHQLNNHISSTYRVDGFNLLNYLAQPNFLYESNEPIKIVNRIKQKYGYMIHQMLEKGKNPFLLNGAEANVEQNASHHKIKFIRTDGENLEALFTPGNMIAIISLLNRATKEALEKGIYSIDSESISEYLYSTNLLNESLERLKNMKEETVR